MNKQRIVGLATGTGILLAGVAGMGGMLALRQPPTEATGPAPEPTTRVATLSVAPTNYEAKLSGYSEVRPRRSVEIAPEVSGTVATMHPELEDGGQVSTGEVLFTLDGRAYRIALEKAVARLEQSRAELERLQLEYRIEKERLGTLHRTRDLTKDRFERAKQLFDDAIGNRTELDAAEEQYNEAVDRVDQHEQALNVYPLRIRQAEHQLALDEAVREQAELDLEHTEVRAPFACRIADARVELGQFVAAGQPAVRLVDDSVLELPVQLEAREARQWLRFASANADRAWFGDVEPVTCTIRWVENPEGDVWKGSLDRIERVDPESRTVTAVVRVTAHQAVACETGGAPLVEGMFCEVVIPGRELRDVFVVPRSAVTFDQTVMIAVDDRLQSVPVEVARTEGETAIVSSGLQMGDELIATRLVNPLENMRLVTDDTE